MASDHDLVVIGGGPAGMAAAVAAADTGLDVALLDAAPRPGGQYYRHPAGEAGGPAEFVHLREGLDRVHYLPGHRVWAVEAGFAVHALAGDRDERPVTVRGRALVIAVGAYDRVIPFPGWDLPGVMTAGGAQALLKGNGVVPGKRMVVAGTGPFLLPVGTGLARAGVRIAGLYEANRPYGLARHMGPARVWEAAGYAPALRRLRLGRAVVAAHGEEAVEAVTVARLDRTWRPVDEHVVECDAVAVGYGFTPQVELALQLGCATRVDADGSLVVAVDTAQRTSVPGVYAAGETTGVGGVELARVEGELAGLAVAGAPSPRTLVRRRRRLRAFAAAVHAAYPVREGWIGWLRDDTLVCRCEEVSRERLTEAVALGATDARSVKLLSRAGMGWCQGRVCGFATACLTERPAASGGLPSPPEPPSAPDGRDVRTLEGASRRMIAQPVRLRDLAEGGDGGPAIGT